jgi:hypothetical protein
MTHTSRHQALIFGGVGPIRQYQYLSFRAVTAVNNIGLAVICNSTQDGANPIETKKYSKSYHLLPFNNKKVMYLEFQ